MVTDIKSLSPEMQAVLQRGRECMLVALVKRAGGHIELPCAEVDAAKETVLLSITTTGMFILDILIPTNPMELTMANDNANPPAANTAETEAAAQNEKAAGATETEVKKAVENAAHATLRELLTNGLHIFEKAAHFTAAEIDDLAEWIHTRLVARASENQIKG